MTDTLVRRGFVEIAEGQVHYRECGSDGDRPTLVMLHASPGSAKMLEPLARGLAGRRRVIAVDTLGNGDSVAPAIESPPVEYFADAHSRALKALGVEHFDLYGTHTGASIAVELTLNSPGRVGRLILDGMSLYSDEQRAEMLQRYAPPVQLDLSGSQLNYIWHFVRDAFLFWPWYRRDAEHLRNLGLPAAETLHEKVVEVLKAATTFHLPYNAAIAYDKRKRLPLVQVPTLLTCSRDDMLMEYFAELRGLLPTAEWLVNDDAGKDGALSARAEAFLSFLDDSSGSRQGIS
jgi:pimeloyl-ACP methyl ester carboxylesterase